MSRPQGRSWNDIRLEDLIVLPDATIVSTHFVQSYPNSPAFTALCDNQQYRIRVRYDATDVTHWIEAHKDQTLVLVIFPYQWEVGASNGVINYFMNATVVPK